MSEEPELRVPNANRFLKPLKALEEKLNEASQIQRNARIDLENEVDNRVADIDRVLQKVKHIEDDRAMDAGRRQEIVEKQENVNEEHKDDSGKLWRYIEERFSLLKSLFDNLRDDLCAKESRVEELEKSLHDHELMSKEWTARYVESEYRHSKAKEVADDKGEKLVHDYVRMEGRMSRLEGFVESFSEAIKERMDSLSGDLASSSLLVGEHFKVHQDRSNEAFQKSKDELFDLLKEMGKKQDKLAEGLKKLEEEFIKLPKSADGPANVQDFIKQVEYNAKHLARLNSQLELRNGE